MRVRLIAVGRRLPRWVNEGYREYARRLPRHCPLELVEIAPGHRGNGAELGRAVREEGARILRAVPRGARVIALEVAGRQWESTELARELSGWLQQGLDLALLIGGAEGLSEECRRAADVSWSLSRLTFPHALVRVVVVEQLYRAFALLDGHPYHR